MSGTYRTKCDLQLYKFTCLLRKKSNYYCICCEYCHYNWLLLCSIVQYTRVLDFCGVNKCNPQFSHVSQYVLQQNNSICRAINRSQNGQKKNIAAFTMDGTNSIKTKFKEDTSCTQILKTAYTYLRCMLCFCTNYHMSIYLEATV